MMKYFLIGTVCATLLGCGEEGYVHPQEGNLAKSGGSPTVRRSFNFTPDDPYTSNDESNDQPVGHFGTLTMSVASLESGNSYTLDVEVDDTTVDRVYVPKGGWVDFYGCELDDDLTGSCLDEQGRLWDFGGEGWGASAWVEEDETEEDLEGTEEEEEEEEEEEIDDWDVDESDGG